MKISKKREAGEMLERAGIASRIIALSNDIAEGNYKNALEKAGQISVLVEAATFDDYWTEKANLGKRKEQSIFINMLEGHIPADRVKNFVNPCLPSK